VDREGVGSEIAVLMSPAAMENPKGPGEPAIIAAVQVDGSGDGVQPQELLVRIGNVAGRKDGDRTISGGYDLTVFFRNTAAGLPEVGCLTRFAAVDGTELVLPIRSGGFETAGLACDLEPDGAGGFREYLVRTTATATKKRRQYATRDIELVRGDVTQTAPTPGTSDPDGTDSTDAPDSSNPAGASGPAAPTTSTTLFVPVRVAGALLDGDTTKGTESDYQSPTSPFLRYSSVTGCGLDIETIPSD
jgi:hypothetical protein